MVPYYLDLCGGVISAVISCYGHIYIRLSTCKANIDISYEPRVKSEPLNRMWVSTYFDIIEYFGYRYFVFFIFLFFIFLGQQTPFIKYVTSLVLLSPSSDSLSQTLCQGFLFIFFHFTSENPRPVYDKLHKMPLILPWLVRKVEIKHQEMEKFLS